MVEVSVEVEVQQVIVDPLVIVVITQVIFEVIAMAISGCWWFLAVGCGINLLRRGG